MSREVRIASSILSTDFNFASSAEFVGPNWLG